MRKTEHNKKPHTQKDKTIPEARLDEMIEEATVDCNDESEQISGFFCILEEQLAVPFTTKLLGIEISVEEISLMRRKPC